MKRGQISIFIILGILILVGVGVIVITNLKGEFLKQEIPAASNLASQRDAMTDYVSECIRHELQRAINKYGICTQDRTQEDLGYGLDIDVTKCTDWSGFSEEGFEVKQNLVDADVEVNDDNIVVEVAYPLTFRRENIEIELNFTKLILNRAVILELEQDSDSKTIKDFGKFTDDGDLSLFIPAGVKVTDGSGNPVRQIFLKMVGICKEAPDWNDPYVVGKLKYSLTPDDVVFEANSAGELPTLTLRYPEFDVPKHVDEEDFMLGWNENDGQGWHFVDAEIDPDDNTVSMKIDHFTDYAILATTKFGTQAMLQDIHANPNPGAQELAIKGHTNCAKNLVGASGYMKSIVYTDTTEYVKKIVETAWSNEIIPVLTIKKGTESIRPRHDDDGTKSWIHPPAADDWSSCDCSLTGCIEDDCKFSTDLARWDYSSIAEEIATMVKEVHFDPDKPLLVELWNEPNLYWEWGGSHMDNQEVFEYVKFYHATATAIRAQDPSPNLYIMNGGLSVPGEEGSICWVKSEEMMTCFDTDKCENVVNGHHCQELNEGEQCEPNPPQKSDFMHDDDNDPATPKVLDSAAYDLAWTNYIRNTYGPGHFVSSKSDVTLVQEKCYNKKKSINNLEYIDTMFNANNELDDTPYEDTEKTEIEGMIAELPNLIDIWAAHIYEGAIGTYSEELDRLSADCPGCPQKVFLTEIGWDDPESKTAEIQTAIDAFEADDRVVGFTNFILSNPPGGHAQWDSWEWATKVCENVCVGNDAYNHFAQLDDYTAHDDCTPEVPGVEYPNPFGLHPVPGNIEWDSSKPDWMKWDSRLDSIPVNYASGDAHGWKLIMAWYEDESQAQGRHNIYVDTINQDGTLNYGPGIKVNGGHADCTKTREHEGMHFISMCDYPIFGGSTYNLQVDGSPSDTVGGMKMPGNLHVNYHFVFQYWAEPEEQT